MTGTVKWFSEKKGYGFITPDEPGEDIFVHHSDIEGKGFKNLNEGDRVAFNVAAGKKGKKAVSVVVINDGEPSRLEAGAPRPDSRFTNHVSR